MNKKVSKEQKHFEFEKKNQGQAKLKSILGINKNLREKNFCSGEKSNFHRTD